MGHKRISPQPGRARDRSRRNETTSRGPGAPTGKGAELRLGAGAAALALASLLLAAFVSVSSPGVQAAHVTFHLYGKALSGWGLTPGGETNPGPTLQVNEGDAVTMILTDEDAGSTGGHGFWVDYNRNGLADAGEPSSPTFISTIYYNFTAGGAASGTYYCTVHSNPSSPTSPMRGTWITNGAPVTRFLAPSGGTDWTGGTSHDVRFNVTDDGPLANVRAWINYTYGGGSASGAIAGPLTPAAGTNSVSWTVPLANVTDLVINITAVDNLGAARSVLSPAATVDSTVPSVAGFSVAADATSVPVNVVPQVTFSEAMNATGLASPAVVSLHDVSAGTYVAGIRTSTGPGTALTFAPSAFLSANTLYEFRVNATAKDASDPGNPLAAAFTSRFTTGAALDTAAPTIASPSVAQTSADASGGMVNVTASVTDNVAVQSVSIHIRSTALGVDRTFAMAPAGGNAFYANLTLAAGTYDYSIRATDTSGNVAYSNGTLTVRTATTQAGFDVLPWAGAGVVVAVAAAVGVLLLRRRRKPRAP